MIDVVMPVRNTGAVFGLALTHLWAHGLSTGLIRSVTICDNASTDPVLAAVLREAAGRPGHRVIRHERDVGVWCSINRGLAATTARYVLVVTADVLLGPATVPILLQAMQEAELAFVGPDLGCIGLERYGAAWATAPEYHLAHDYNGACWLMDWSKVRERVGWYDPRFYICAGDVDFIERLLLVAQEEQDARWLPLVVRGAHICHLDKQTRRSAPAQRDATIEIRDLTRLHEKWRATHPDICARHPIPAMEDQLRYKASDQGGWEAGRIV